MEKLPFRLVLLLLCFQYLGAQDTLCVYKSKGAFMVEHNNKLNLLQKGTLINKKHLVKVLPQAEFTAIDNSGNTYLVNVNGKYGFRDILNFKSEQKKSNLTAAYFKHIWDELLKTKEDKALIAGVFRSDLLMVSPNNNSKIASSKITFKWQILENTEFYYVFLRNIKTDELLKIETNGSQLALYNESPIFYDSTHFEWAVSQDAFPNLDNLTFFAFELIDRNQYEEEKTAYKDFILDLKSLGVSEEEIEAILCERFKLCK
ncbi:hypothetical protein [Seonamhaeicola sp. ML3]|uniref:hypothetical protein n=1 Tax=Seonamhaeicola sp. ML3 TaxID=2937786 RepID=UPI00200EE6C0|nr:hypothetical protein [Seonamhaeicola sp. ML3]